MSRTPAPKTNRTASARMWKSIVDGSIRCQSKSYVYIYICIYIYVYIERERSLILHETVQRLWKAENCCPLRPSLGSGAVQSKVFEHYPTDRDKRQSLDMTATTCHDMPRHATTCHDIPSKLTCPSSRDAMKQQLQIISSKDKTQREKACDRHLNRTGHLVARQGLLRVQGGTSLERETGQPAILLSLFSPGSLYQACP